MQDPAQVTRSTSYRVATSTDTMASDAENEAYEDADKTEPLTKTELKAWYAFDWGNSAYASVAGGAFLPILLQQVALQEVSTVPLTLLQHTYNNLLCCPSPAASTLPSCASCPQQHQPSILAPMQLESVAHSPSLN